MSKKYDLVVKTGEYQNNNGETKGRFQNVGAVMQGKDGPYIIMERTFNPAGLPNPDNRSSVIISLYEPKEQQQGQQQSQAPQQQQQQQNQAPNNQGFDQDIPFNL